MNELPMITKYFR